MTAVAAALVCHMTAGAVTLPAGVHHHHHHHQQDPVKLKTTSQLGCLFQPGFLPGLYFNLRYRPSCDIFNQSMCTFNHLTEERGVDGGRRALRPSTQRQHTVSSGSAARRECDHPAHSAGQTPLSKPRPPGANTIHNSAPPPRPPPTRWKASGTLGTGGGGGRSR